MTAIKHIEHDFCTMTLREDGVLEQRFVEDEPYEVTAEELIKFRESFLLISNGVKLPMISIAGKQGSISADARDINISSRYTSALALVIVELPQRLLSNFYFKIKKVDYPIKTFKTEEEATKWLLQQTRRNQLVG